MSYTYFIITLITSFILTVITTRFLISRLQRRGIGQRILDIGPAWHKSKEGTPTMGGISFIIALLPAGALCIALPLISGVDPMPLALTLIFVLMNSLVGLGDDLTKVRRGQNLGFTAKQKLLLQLIIAAAYISLMVQLGHLDYDIYIPFLNRSVDFGLLFYPFTITLILGSVNCANLTDGVDGLATTVAFGIGFFYSILASSQDNALASTLSALICGAALAFLVYNIHPAKIFMGDTGSLFLGAAVCGFAFMINNPIIVLIAGIVYVIEGASVIIQVICYKLFHRRIFRMAPLHHHMEKCGFSENRIVLTFFVLTVIFCFLASFGVK